MSVLESIRSRTGLLVGLVGLALAIFILESLLGSGRSLFGGGNTTVGTIAGDNIDYAQYSNKVNEQIAMVMQNNPNANVDDNMRQQINDIVWNSFISEKVVKPQYKKVGVSVSEDELYDLMLVHPHQMVLQQLTDKNTGRIHEVVATPDGNLDLIKLNQWVNGMTPDAERFWLNLETGIAESRLAEKYGVIIKKGLYVTTAEAKEMYAQQNKSMNVGYVIKRYDSVSDSIVKVTNDDIQKYYNDHQYMFKSYETTRNIDYVSFDVVPSDKDMADIEKNANEVAAKFKTIPVKEDSAFMAEESEGGAITVSDLNRKTMIIRDSSVYTDPAGTVYGPYNEGAFFKIYKLEKIKSIADSARQRHILLAYKGADRAPQNVQLTKDQAKRIADSITGLLKEKKVVFDSILKYTNDPGSIPKGGDYGWFNEGSGFVPEFKNAGLQGTVGNISVVESQFGYHIIEVLEVSKTSHTAYQVAQIFKLIAPSAETTKEYYKAASEFSGQNNTSELYEKAIEKQKLSKRIAENVKESDKSLPGLEGAKELVKWAYTATKGEVSPQVFEFKDKFVVARLTGIKEKGTLPLEEVKDEVTLRARQAKKAEEFVKEFTSKAGTASKLEDVSSKMGITIGTSEKLTFSAFSVGTLGREDALIGTASALKAGSISKPVIGENGVFVVGVATIDQGPPVTDNYKAVKMQTEQMLGGRSDYEVYNALREKANIEDHRAKFE
jgi:peptidyl-prolyl cis-trans isomerase D